MPSYKNYQKEVVSELISKELLNKNRVLTMSNNRKCNYLIVNCGKDLTTMMAINIQGNRKDILVVKSFRNKSFLELINEAYWLCNEFDIKLILADKNGFGIEFIDIFKVNFDPYYIQIREINGNDINKLNINNILDDLKYGMLRFLQSPELAQSTYIKPFLGLSTMMDYHRETDKLIDEINNIDFNIINGVIKLSRRDENIGKSRVSCLLMFYTYYTEIIYENHDNSNEKYEIAKRNVQYEVIHGIFYKYLFKCIENKKINVIFYHNGKHKINQFKNIINEEKFIELIKKYTSKIIISKDRFEIIFLNGSSIKFVYTNDGARGYRYHFAVIDTEIEKEIFDSVVSYKGILFDIAKREGRLEKDNYNIEFLDM